MFLGWDQEAGYADGRRLSKAAAIGDTGSVLLSEVGPFLWVVRVSVFLPPFEIGYNEGHVVDRMSRSPS